MTIKEKIMSGNVVATEHEDGNQLGNIFWYSITGEVEITRDSLHEKFNEIGIEENWLPNEIRPSDAFRRATRETQRKKVPTSNPNVYKNYLVREVYSGTDMIQRNIVVEIVDQSGKRLDYEPKATVMTLEKENNNFVIWVEDGEEYAGEMAKEAKNKFIKYVEYYSSQQLRVMVSKYLGSLAPTSVRSNGGVYFVPRNYSNDLKKLEILCGELNSEGVSIPMYDTSDNRNIVLTRLENELKDTLNRCKELNQTDDMKKAIYKDSIEESRKLVKTYQAYKEQLSLDTDSLENMISELRLTAVSLTRKMTKR